MAKRRRTVTKRARSRPSFRAKRRRSKGTNPTSVIIPAVIYGAARERVSGFIAPFTARVPLGGLADELGMGVLGFMAAKRGKGLLKKVGMAALTIESARVGSSVINGSLLRPQAQSGLSF